MTNFKQMKQSAQKGFTLIILASVALPAYSDYTTRAKVSEVILAATSCKINVAEYVQSSGGTPSTSAAWACDSQSSTYVSSVTADVNGEITAVAAGDPKITGGTVTLTPAGIGTGTITGWTCGGTILPQYLPANCR